MLKSEKFWHINKVVKISKYRIYRNGTGLYEAVDLHTHFSVTYCSTQYEVQIRNLKAFR